MQKNQAMTWKYLIIKGIQPSENLLLHIHPFREIHCNKERNDLPK